MGRSTTLLVGLAVAALLATGCEWHFETLDGNGGPNGRTTRDVGRFVSAVLYDGRPHVFYLDADTNDLRHAYYNGSAWAFETLDGNQDGPHGQVNGSVGDNGSALLYNGRPHVFYRDNKSSGLRHAYYNGQYWSFEVLDGNGGPGGRTTHDVGFATAVILYNGRLHVFYLDNATFDLRHAYYNGSTWSFETLDGAGGPNGRIMANTGYDNAVVLYNGRPHVFYRTNPDPDLRHAYYSGSAWAFETLDGNGGGNGRIVGSVGHYNAAVVSGGRLRVFYQYLGGIENTLRQAYYTGTAWGFETLDGAGGPNGRLDAFVGADSAVVLFNGRPDVFYHDDTSFDLRHAYFG